MTSETLKGTVKFWSSRKQYGFITSDNGQDHFVHETQITTGDTRLYTGQRVQYGLSMQKGKMAAANVRVAI